MNGLPAGEHVGRTLGELFPTLMQVLGPHINGVFEDGQSRIGLEFSGPSPTRQMRSGRWIVCIYPVRSQARIIGVGSVVIDVSDGPESGALGLKNLPSMQSMFNVPARAAGGNAPLAGGDTRPRSAEPGTKDAVSTLPPSLARVAAGVARGLVDKEIARELSIPLPTVRTYVRRIYRRLGVTNRVSLALCWTAADGGTRREGRS